MQALYDISKRTLIKIYSFEIKTTRRFITKLILRYDGGEQKSNLLREIFSKYHKVTVGLYSYGCFKIPNFPPGTNIGRYCSFAKNCTLIPGNHPVGFRSTHPFFFNPDFGYVKELKIVRTQFSIGHDVWMGTNSIVLPSASRIGTGSIIGAGSVVTRDVPPFAIVAGNPARIIKYRFSEKTITEILESKWWELDIDQIKNDSKRIEEFIVPVE